jgi:hypothetical protein
MSRKSRTHDHCRRPPCVGLAHADMVRPRVTCHHFSICSSDFVGCSLIGQLAGWAPRSSTPDSVPVPLVTSASARHASITLHTCGVQLKHVPNQQHKTNGFCIQLTHTGHHTRPSNQQQQPATYVQAARGEAAPLCPPSSPPKVPGTSQPAAAVPSSTTPLPSNTTTGSSNPPRGKHHTLVRMSPSSPLPHPFQ